MGRWERFSPIDPYLLACVLRLGREALCCNVQHMNRISVSVTDWQLAALEEIAASEETSVAHVARTALRDQLPRLLEFSRLMSGEVTPETAAHVIELTDRLELQLGQNLYPREGQGDAAGVATGDVAAPPPPRHFRPKPPSTNRGVN